MNNSMGRDIKETLNDTRAQVFFKRKQNITKRHLNLKSEEAQDICRMGYRMTYIQPTKYQAFKKCADK